MTCRVLVVDGNAANRKLIEVRLTAEYFDVLSATSGPAALSLCEKAMCDIVLLAAAMPNMDGFEVCRRLKSQVSTAHVMIVMLTAFDQPTDRLRAFAVGADDFVVKPIDEARLMARIRSLSRIKTAIDELRDRASESGALDRIAPLAFPSADNGRGGRLLVVDDDKVSAERISGVLTPDHSVTIEANQQEAMFKAAEGELDVVIINLGLTGSDALRLCAQIRAVHQTRNLSVLVIAGPADHQRVVRALELGINDWLSAPIDEQELLARVRTQLRYRRYAEKLRIASLTAFKREGIASFLFVSHVSEDFAAAIAIVEELEKRGVKCWIAPRDVRAGQPFDDEIANAIDACLAMLLIFSDRCNESDYVRRELTVAGDAKKLIVPLRIENVKPKGGLRLRLSDLHWIDAFVQRETAIDRLIEIITAPP